MSLSPDFVRSLESFPLEDFLNLLDQKDRPNFNTKWVLKNEIRPVDIYCYLSARFGAPNGIQSLLRKNDTDNLIHWDWILRSGTRIVMILGLNFRTEISISGDPLEESGKEQFIQETKGHFSELGAEMGRIRKSLEHWIEFVNPYQRIRRAVMKLLDDIEKLDLDAERDHIPEVWEPQRPEDIKNKWDEQADKYSRAIGMCFGVRSMLPVMAEAFVNMLLYILMKPDLKKDERLRENVIRQPIDIRIRRLSYDCSGFKQHVDYGSDACKRYHTLVNERNDLLHGNVVIEKLRFNELYFNGTVPVFTHYSSMWERSLGVMQKAVGLDTVRAELTVVDNMIEYLMSCLDEKLRDSVRLFIDKFDLGVCLDDGRLGVLFPDWLVDFAAGP